MSRLIGKKVVCLVDVEAEVEIVGEGPNGPVNESTTISVKAGEIGEIIDFDLVAKGWHVQFEEKKPSLSRIFLLTASEFQFQELVSRN